MFTSAFKVVVPKFSLVIKEYMYLSGAWLGVMLRMDTKKISSKENGLHAKNSINILNVVVNIVIVETYVIN